jgi:hypothetical protein
MQIYYNVDDHDHGWVSRKQSQAYCTNQWQSTADATAAAATTRTAAAAATSAVAACAAAGQELSLLSQLLLPVHQDRHQLPPSAALPNPAPLHHCPTRHHLPQHCPTRHHCTTAQPGTTFRSTAQPGTTSFSKAGWHHLVLSLQPLLL